MIIAGDQHNFGRRVQARLADSGLVIDKPRTVFWEWFFFGNSSPLKKVFNSNDLITNFFGLSILNMESNSGTVEMVTEDSFKKEAYDSRLLSQFGGLLAYTFLFGIEDLHSENLVFKNNLWQVVDVEVVCSDFDLPHQTHLLPYKNVNWSKTKLSALLAEETTFKPEIFSLIIDTFSQVAFEFLNNREHICATLDEYKPHFSETPNRLILRSTQEYTGALELTSKLIDEELSQLERGDIPYFFSFLGSEQIFYYVSSDLKYAEISPQSFRELKTLNLNRSQMPNELLSEENIKNRLANGLCFLVDKFFPTNSSTDLNIGNLEIKVSPDNLVIKNDLLEIASERAQYVS